MQTFRDCERQVDIALTGESVLASCQIPQTYADILCGPISSTDTPMIPGASRAMMYGGGYLKYRYDVAIVNDSQMPCSFSFKIVTAVAVLPLLEDDLTPAYLPSLAVARSQLSVVHSTQSDTDENLLYWDDGQFSAYNISCTGLEGICPPRGPNNCSDQANDTSSRVWESVFAVMYGRKERYERIRVKRRLKEREALFLLTQIVHPITDNNSRINWPIRRTVYHRYAVRVSR